MYILVSYIAVLLMCLFEMAMQPFIKRTNKLHISSHAENKDTVDRLRKTIPAFTPLLHGPVLQTLSGVILSMKRPSRLKWTYHVIKEQSRYWKYLSNDTNDTNTIVCVPGLSGDVNSHYINQLAGKCMQEKWNCFVLDKRNVDVGCVVELNALVNEVSKSFKRITLMGISIGGNVICRYCASSDVNSSVRLCVSIGNGFNWKAVSCSMHYVWSSILLVGYKRWLSSKTTFNTVNMKRSPRTLWAFNEELFKTNIEDYLLHTSSHEVIEQTNTPLFIINSMDDPFFSYTALDNIYNVIHKNKNIYLLSTTIGGHIGWCKDFHNVSWVFDDVLPTIIKMF